MPIKVQTPTTEQIRELRNRFNTKYERSPPSVPFHSNDLNRVRNDDLWCRLFLEMYDLDMQVSFDKLWDTCIWRQQYGANELTESSLRQEYLKDGVIFAHNKDIDGKPLLIFKTKLHVKGSKDMDEVMRVVVYWIERIHRETNMDKMTVFFDMAGTGMGNMDLDFVKRIIETFKLYYPNALNYILVYEMAWVLNAVFKIIKGLLPAKALEILKMITKKDINTYIDKTNCLACWGGTDDYAFSFVPEKPQKKLTLALKSNGIAKPANGHTPISSADSQLGVPEKKVHFANGSPAKLAYMSDYKDFKDHNTIYKDYTPEDNDIMLRISPQEFIEFGRSSTVNESIVDITCTANMPVTYKIQTTSPEKFRVRPRCGVLNAGESVAVNILLKPEHSLADGSKDKFLVMCMPLPPGADSVQQHIIEMWKQKPTNSPDLEQHRLCCIYKGGPDGGRNGMGMGHAEGKELLGGKPGSPMDLSQHALQLERQLRFTQILQVITLVFLLVLSAAVLYLLKLQTAAEEALEEVLEDGALPHSQPSVASCGKGGRQ